MALTFKVLYPHANPRKCAARAADRGGPAARLPDVQGTKTKSPNLACALRAQLTEADLQRAFQMFGVVVEVKIYRKGSYGFVQFERHEDAVRAIVNMNGGNLGGRALKCSWGRHQARRSLRPPPAVCHLES